MKITTKILVLLTLLLCVYCQGKSNQYSSAEKTWNKLVQSAKAKNFQEFVRCIDLTIVYQNRGHSEEEAIKMDKKVKANINNSSREAVELREMLNGFIDIMFTDAEFIVINEEEEGLNLRVLEVKCIPNSPGYSESIDKWYFTNCDGKWLINFEVTMMKKIMRF